MLIRALLALPASKLTVSVVSLWSEKLIQKTEVILNAPLWHALKLNIDEECFSYKPPKALLELKKSSVRQYNEEHGSYN